MRGSGSRPRQSGGFAMRDVQWPQPVGYGKAGGRGRRAARVAPEALIRVRATRRGSHTVWRRM
eukprot:scaffold5943_cov113-Isochrysis_galbana.AAC.4